MPTKDEDVKMAADEASAADASAREEMIGQALPPAEESLDPQLLGEVADQLRMAVGAITGGQVKLPPWEPGDEPTDEVPVELGKYVAGTRGLLDVAKEQGVTAAATYDDVNPGMLTTNKGLQGLSELLAGLAADRAVAEGIAGIDVTAVKPRGKTAETSAAKPAMKAPRPPSGGKEG